MDIGCIDDIDPEESEVSVRFDGWAVCYGFGELDAGRASLSGDDTQEPRIRIPGGRDPFLIEH